MENGWIKEDEPLNFSTTNHAPFNKLYDVSCPTPWSCAKKIASEVVLYVNYGFKLLGYLGLGYKWALSLYQLIIYATLLLPGFIQVILFYFFSPRVSRSVAYGAGPRQRLDMYLTKNRKPGQKYPVVIFVTGGAWTIGYKAWGALLAKRLSQAGALVACLDYRNFPQGNALQMLEDVNRGIAWVCNQCANYQGDPDNIILCGQSAGGQLGALALIKQVEQVVLKKEVVGAQPAWDPSSIRAFVGISGAYDLEGLAGHLHSRGLYNNLFSQIMSINGVPAISELSPLHAARAWSASDARLPISVTTMDGPILTETSVLSQSPTSRDPLMADHQDGRASSKRRPSASPAPSGFGARMPTTLFIHGTADKSVPFASSQLLHEALERAGVASTCKLIEGRTHTSFLLEGAMKGGRDELMELMHQVVYGPKVPAKPRRYPALCPAILCYLAGYICPF